MFDNQTHYLVEEHMEPDDVHAEPIRIIAAEDIRTIRDLEDHLWSHPSPIVCELIKGAIRFFSDTCASYDGRRDWKAIQERKHMGLDFQLTPDHTLTSEIIDALTMWMAGYGREIGTTFFDVLMSKEMGGITNPRASAFKLLKTLKARAIRAEVEKKGTLTTQNAEKGTVKFFDERPDKNYGFITLESGEEIFFHLDGRFTVTIDPNSITPVFNSRMSKDERRVPKKGERICCTKKSGAETKRVRADPWCFADDWERIEKNIAEELTFEQLPTKEPS